jgi:cardiolipin synthase A/B
MTSSMNMLPAYEPINVACDGNQLSFLFDGRERLHVLLDAIAKATQSLRLFYYIFCADDSGTVVANALIESRRRGVEVTFLVDGFGTQDMPQFVFQPLIDAGVRFNRFLPRFGRRYLLRNHQKMLIADEQVAIIGGSNIESSYFADDPAGNGWHDLSLRIEGPKVAHLSCYFDALARWLDAPKPTIRQLNAILSKFSESKGLLRWVFSGPFPRINPLRRAIVADITRSKHVDMIQAYFAPNGALVRKLRRVPKLRLITAAKSDSQTTINAARYCYTRLLNAGAEISEYVAQRLHMKLIIADDVTYVGSANFDIRSLYLNAEVMLRIEDAGVAAHIRDAFDRHFEKAERVTRDAHLKRSSWRARLVWFLSYLLVSTVDFTLTRSFIGPDD